MIIKRLVSIWDWTSLDENLLTKKHSEFSYLDLQNKIQNISVLYKRINSKYIYSITWLSKSFDSKEEVRRVLWDFLSKNAKLLDKKEFTKKISFTSPTSKPKVIKNFTKEDMIKKYNEEKAKILKKIRFWSNPKIQMTPIWLWGIGLIASTFLSWGLGFWAVILGGIILFFGWNYIEKKIDENRIKLEKMKKIQI